MIVVVPTIQHTGSFFVAKHLLDFMTPRNLDDKGGGCYFDHTFTHKMQRFVDLLQLGRGIAPLRHPAEIVRSWNRRKKDLDDLWMQTRNLISIQGQLFILPIDHPERQDYLDQAERHLNLPLSTDWRIVHSVGDIQVPDCPDTQRYIDDFRPFFSRFYEL